VCFSALQSCVQLAVHLEHFQVTFPLYKMLNLAANEMQVLYSQASAFACRQNKSNFRSCNSDNFFLPIPVPSACFYFFLYFILCLIYSSCLALCHLNPLETALFVLPSFRLCSCTNSKAPEGVFITFDTGHFGQVVEQCQVALSSDSLHDKVTERLRALLHV